MNLTDYLTLTDISKRWDVSRTYIWKLIKDGRIPAEMLGGRWLIKRKNFEALEAEGKEEGK